MEQIERWITEAETVVLKNTTLNTINVTANETLVDFDLPEEEHDTDAYSTTILNVTIIACLLLAYYVKQYRLYFLPESAGALIIGCLVGAIARLVTDNLQFFEFVSSNDSPILEVTVQTSALVSHTSSVNVIIIIVARSFLLCSSAPHNFW
jgi:hypothetical protein